LTLNGYRLFLLLLATAWCSLIGCREARDSYNVKADSPGWGSLQIVMPSDTLRFVPGDSAVAQGFVVVKDAAQNAVPGVRVHIELTEPFGVIEFVNSDTTNAQGRVSFWFRTYRDETGNDTIHAYVGGMEAFWPITVLPAVEVLGRIGIGLSKGVLFSLSDSVIVELTLTDSGRAGIPGFQPILSATGGHWTPFPPTDSIGLSQAIWYPDDYGIFTLVVTFESYKDSTSVIVMDTSSQRHARTLDRKGS
jgi:hypothetical protein